MVFWRRLLRGNKEERIGSMHADSAVKMALFVFNSNEISDQVDSDYGSYAQARVLAAVYTALKPCGGWTQMPVLHGCHGDLFYDNIVGQPVGMAKLAEWFRHHSHGISLAVNEAAFRRAVESAVGRLGYVPYAVGLWPLSEAVIHEIQRNLLAMQPTGYVGLVEMNQEVGRPQLLDELCLLPKMHVEAGCPHGWRLSHKDLVESGFVQEEVNVSGEDTQAI